MGVGGVCPSRLFDDGGGSFLGVKSPIKGKRYGGEFFRHLPFDTVDRDCCMNPRYLTSFRDKIPCALAEAFGEDNVALSAPGVEPPRSPTPRASTSSASCGGIINGSKLGTTAARAPVELPSWLASRPGFPSLVASPPTPLLVKLNLSSSY